MAEIGHRYRISAGILHFGGVRFPLYGPVRFTMKAAEGLRTAKVLGLRTVVPMHFEDWAHFCEPATRINEAFALAGESSMLHWPRRGEAIEIDV
jgi:L-ascorbate metabolism protein UlaG (beta-lactamase superfamily)